jgi:hypothetical protein
MANEMNGFDAEVLQHIRLDMEQVYEQHRAAENMIHNMLKMSLAILALPILAFGAFLTAGIISPTHSMQIGALSQTNVPAGVAATGTPNLNQPPIGNTAVAGAKADPSDIAILITLPGMLAYIAILTAVLNALPIMSIVEHHMSETLCKHAINNFRMLYINLKDQSENTVLKNWIIDLSTDKNHPPPLAGFSSANLISLFLVFVNSVLIAAGYTSLCNKNWTQFLASLAVTFIIYLALYLAFAQRLKGVFELGKKTA